jgi:hypothetical protein
MALRNQIADEFGISAHKACNNKILSSLAYRRPSNLKNLTKIDDFPLEKVETIGTRFIERINQFCTRIGLEMDNFSKTNTNYQESSDKSEALLISHSVDNFFFN